jgi:16S rRNA (cytosine1402-N4)-methyltransferase
MDESGEVVLHVPVLVEEILAGLRCRSGGQYLDCTVGQGGLAAKILDASRPNGMLIGVDRDLEAIAAARERLALYGPRARLIHGNFGDLKWLLQSIGAADMDGVVFDLGVSSHQLSQAERGFSFMADGPLDMRMDQSTGQTAAELLRRLPEAALAEVLLQYGEERYARRIARAVVRARARGPVTRTSQLVALIRDAVPAASRHGRLHFATRTFQALRIAVNRELDVLEPAIRAATDVLAPGGRLCILSFHSLEDRIAKTTLRALSRGSGSPLVLISKKPYVPSREEVQGNPRARSAKLRIAERVPAGRSS